MGKDVFHYPTRKFEIIAIDLFGEGALMKQRGYKAVTSVQDRLTSFVQSYAVRTKKWGEILKLLQERWFFLFEKPRQMLADNAFRTKEIGMWSSAQGIKFTYCGAHRHEQNGQIERFKSI